jgi:hypothetical protein
MDTVAWRFFLRQRQHISDTETNNDVNDTSEHFTCKKKEGEDHIGIA